MILSTILKREGHKVNLFDGNFSHLKSLADHLDRDRYDFIGISGLITTFLFQRSAAEIAKKHGQGAIVASGGGLASSTGEELLDLIPDLDIVFVGEAERTLPSSLSNAELPIVIGRRQVITGKIEFNLDSIPIPDLTDWHVEQYFNHGSFPLSPAKEEMIHG